MSGCDVAFASMGSETRLVLDGADPEPQRAFFLAYERTLTRFDTSSELSRLNASPQPRVPASPLLRRAVRAAVWAAQRSAGLVDPTLLGALCAAGYERSRSGPELSLADALADAPSRAPARPSAAADWRKVAVDDAARAIVRPPGVGLDLGGTGKGLAADLLAARLEHAPRFAVDCGGDLRVGGSATRDRRFEVHVRHPLTGGTAHVLALRTGAVATSGLDVRLWRDGDGRPAHHLLDPATGRPAWTGLIGATALAPTALEAETLAKTALLSGPARAGRILAAYGGLAVREDGEVELAGSLRPRILVRLPRNPLAGAATPALERPGVAS